MDALHRAGPIVGHGLRGDALRGLPTIRPPAVLPSLMLGLVALLAGARLAGWAGTQHGPLPVPVEVQATVLPAPVPVASVVSAGPPTSARTASAGPPTTRPAVTTPSTVPTALPSAGRAAPVPTVHEVPSARTHPAPSQASVLPPVAPSRTVPWCRYTVDVFNRQPTAFGAKIVLTNVSRGSWSGWAGTVTVEPAAPAASSWGATFRGAGSTLTVTPADYNSLVDPGNSVELGLQSSSSGLMSRVTAVTVDGHDCTAQ